MVDPTTDTGVPEDVAAAELALGLLEGEERGAALRRVLAEPGFAAQVEWWRSRLAVLFDLWPEHAAPPHLAARIEASLDGTPAPAQTSRFAWPALAAVTSAIAASLLLFVMIRPEPTVPVSQPIPVARPTSVLVAMLGDTKSPVAAVYDPANGALRVAAGPGVPDARVAQLWVIGGDGVPHSLGLLSGRPTSLALKGVDRGRITPGATLAISVEPLGGSPTGLPTGPVVATGVVARV
ncbi:anti-sigma-K factor RskA [Sphingomonas sp. PP-CE-1A-559]|uniref:anti-sigma factor n=1 Tax=Sphingomonas sp. PP-CE-1A-559 TaxID=2135657 RepID=UPI001056AEFF|nr:anti-sigma factor [Sphingomonas sp. PP-CE-1A-559]TCP91384.1 anti-sigma-K factor RskA [Sphingomonas sp. PP-CE-1A-559]